MTALHIHFLSPRILLCLHCGQSLEMPGPPLVLLPVMRAFTDQHRACVLSPKGPACPLCFAFGHDRVKCPTREVSHA